MDKTDYMYITTLPNCSKLPAGQISAVQLPSMISLPAKRMLHWNKIASLVGRQRSVYLYDSDEILVRQSDIDGAAEKSYPPYFVPEFCICRTTVF